MINYKVLITAITCLFVCNTYAESINLTTAKNLSRESGKNIFVNYTADWCLPCQIFKDQVLENNKVASLLGSDFIVIESDYDDQESKAMFEDYAIACMPTLHILDKEGEVLSELSGTMTADKFYEEIAKYAMKGNPPTTETVLVTRPIPVASSISNTPRTTITEYYTIQAGAFSSFDNALKQKSTILKEVSEKIEIIEDSERKLYILCVGKYTSKEELETVAIRLKDASIEYFVKRKKRI